MAEVEIAGAKIKGGKILLILPILGTLGGGLWGGFEFYKDYMNMRERIESYEAPDLSGFEKKLAVLHEEMQSLKQMESMIKQSADDARDYTKDIKRDLKDEMHHMSKQLDDVEKRGKEAFRLVRESIDTNDAKVRLKAMVDSSDGFNIAEIDLKLRGPGDILGTRQSGLINFKLASIVKDHKILTLARLAAGEILKQDFELSASFNRPIKRYFEKYHSNCN